MTSSDRTLLPDDAFERNAARVGTSIEGSGERLGSESGVRLAFACAEFNGGITDRLLTGGLDALEESGTDPEPRWWSGSPVHSSCRWWLSD